MSTPMFSAASPRTTATITATAELTPPGYYNESKHNEE